MNVNPSTRKSNLLVLLVLTAVTVTGPARAEVGGTATIGAGYLEHPRGLAAEPTANYVSESLRVFSDLGVGPRTLRLGYEGSAGQFSNDTQLGSMRHALGLEVYRYAAGSTDNISAGVQGSFRSYEDSYEIYDHRDLYAYVAFKHRGTSANLWRGSLAVRVRRYGDLPEESYIEPHVRLEYKRFLKSRTTLGLSLRYGIKFYDDSAASRVWVTPNFPSVSQLAARLAFAQGLSDRFALRGWGEFRFRLEDFPRYVEDDIYDSPLLDTYAHDGFDGFLALKYLTPLQIWLEGGVSYGDHDYGSLLFATVDGGAERSDQTVDLYLSARRQLGKSLGRPRLFLAGGWRDQSSSLAGYTYAGAYASTSLAWHF